MSPDVKIPLNLLNDTVSILEIICRDDSFDNYPSDFLQFFDSVLSSLVHKQHSLELRSAYSKIVSAKSENSRTQARNEYLALKRSLNNELFINYF